MSEPKQYVRTDPDGSMRVGQTRLLLNMVVDAYQNGKSAEAIRHAFPVISLEEAHGSIAFYLGHQKPVDDYIERWEAQAEEIRKDWQAQHPAKFTREILMARMRERTKSGG